MCWDYGYEDWEVEYDLSCTWFWWGSSCCFITWKTSRDSQREPNSSFVMTICSCDNGMNPQSRLKGPASHHSTVDYVLVCDLQGHVHIIPQQGVQNKRNMGIVWASGPEAVIPGRSREFGHFLEEVKPLGVEIERGAESRLKTCARCAETAGE